jgi:putative transposase
MLSAVLWFRTNRTEHNYKLEDLYAAVPISRQAVAKMVQRQSDRQSKETALLAHVKELRQEHHPAIGCRKLYHVIRNSTEQASLLYFGRRKFEQLVIQNGLGSPLFKARYKHKSTKKQRFTNLLVDKVINGTNQVWISDTTYFNLFNRWYYLTSVIDYYSRRVLAAHLSKGLSAEETSIAALKKAIDYRGAGMIEGCIFHSDGGSQYSDAGFLAIIEQHKMVSSMARLVFENTVSERFNGIFKQEYITLRPPQNEEQLEWLTDYAQWSFNKHRPHGALKYQTPIGFETHQMALDIIQRVCVSAWTLPSNKLEVETDTEV